MRRIIPFAAPLVGALATSIVAAGCGASKPHGYYDMHSLSEVVNSKLVANATTVGQVPNHVGCFRRGSQGAVCTVSYPGGRQRALSVTISPNGETFVAG